ncbi:MlaE family lipid ABC transporter permease subunit [Candidatus Kinetoplastibacterium sorsogonicusi]|nr:MlaE family lipid ABC transporter permease subunit [Candidatus Kinetoplastibacterium sorsogonicusi]
MIKILKTIISFLKKKIIFAYMYIHERIKFLLTIMLNCHIIISRPKLIIDQIFFIGNKSISIISASGLFVGLVLGLQGYHHLKRYGAEQTLGLVVGLSLIRELGPVITSLLFTGRAGTSITAEIGLMQIGEQISAMEIMSINPIKRILAPRFLAGIISIPILVSIFNVIGILGGWIIGVLFFEIDNSMFWTLMQEGIDSRDILNSLIKSIIFGFAILFTTLFEGMKSKHSPSGVALATTKTVIIGSLYILVLDLLLTTIMFIN